MEVPCKKKKETTLSGYFALINLKMIYISNNLNIRAKTKFQKHKCPK